MADDDGPGRPRGFASVHPESSWDAVDLSNVDGLSLRPTIGERTDGVGLLYPGLVHAFNGEPESLKSWAAQVIAAQVLEAGEDVLYVDMEDHPHNVRERLISLGVAKDVVEDPDRFRYIQPSEPLSAARGLRTFHYAVLVAHLSRRWDLAVIDGVTEAMTGEGLDPLGNTDVAEWMALLPRLVAAMTGAAVVVIDHVTKATEGRGRYAIGAQHKLAGIDGAAYTVTVVQRLRRALGGEPTSGKAQLRIAKDRHGWLRGEVGPGDEVVYAVLDLVAYPDGGITARYLPPTDSAATSTPPAALLVEILRHVEVYAGCSGRAIREVIPRRAEDVVAALRWLVDKLWIEVRPVGRAHLHHLTDLGRSELEDLRG